MPDSMHTVSEVEAVLLRDCSEYVHVYFIIVSDCLILAGDILRIANETGLNITDIQEALLNFTSITDLLRPGELSKLLLQV